jgi:hypothetical protein
MEMLTGGKAAKLQKQQAEAGQRRNLAELARQQGEVDQAAAGAGGGKRRAGRGLLTFLSGDGQASFG